MRSAALAAALAFAVPLAPACRADPAAWRVTAPGGGELWLLGSVHYLRPADYPLPLAVDELYAGADALVMELDLDDLDVVASQSELVSAALLPADARLKDAVPEAVYRLVAQRAAELELDLALLDRFEPWLVAVTLLDRGMAARGFDAASGLEQHLLRRAREDGKEITGLESLAAQIAVFDRLSTAEQRALLEQTLLELESPETEMAELVDAWRAGRLDELSDRLMDEFDEFPALYESLVADRNESWVAPLSRLVRSPERHLVVVGALHLVGEHSVVELLRARGFDVTPLP